MGYLLKMELEGEGSFDYEHISFDSDYISFYYN